MEEYQDETRLIDYLYIFWKRKWLIIIPTLFFAISAGIYGFLLTPVYEINGIIQPSKSIIQTEGGEIKEILFFDPSLLAKLINQSSVNNLAAAELNLDVRSYPELNAENIPDTKLIRVSIRGQDVDKAKINLLSFFNHLKKELDVKADLAINAIETQMESNKIEKMRMEREIEILKDKVKSTGLRKKGIEEEISHTTERLDSLKKEQASKLEKSNRNESENMGLLFSTNEIQQSQIHLDTLKELLASKNMEEADINIAIEEKKERSKQLENTFNNLKDKKTRIEYAKIIKEPASSPRPVFPKKQLMVLIAGMLGFTLFTILAFFLEYLKKTGSQKGNRIKSTI